MQTRNQTAFSDISSIGGCITCDGVKCDPPGKKLEDFVLHYFELPKSRFMGSTDWNMKTQLLLIARHDGPEDATKIRRAISKKLKKRFRY